MSPFEQAAEQVLARLDAAGTAYRVIGAAALAAHGVSRSTRDLDLLVADPSVLDADRWRGHTLPGFSLTVHRGDPLDPLDGVVRLEADLTDEAPWDAASDQLDIVVLRATWARAMLTRSGPPVAIGAHTTPTVDAADLVLLKLHAGGPKDRWDVLSLLEAVPDRTGLIHLVEERLGALSDDARRTWESLRG